MNRKENSRFKSMTFTTSLRLDSIVNWFWILNLLLCNCQYIWETKLVSHTTRTLLHCSSVKQSSSWSLSKETFIDVESSFRRAGHVSWKKTFYSRCVSSVTQVSTKRMSVSFLSPQFLKILLRYNFGRIEPLFIFLISITLFIRK